LQGVAVCCSVLQGVAVCDVSAARECVRAARETCTSCNVSECCSVMQCVALCCTVLQCVAVCCSVLQCVT